MTTATSDSATIVRRLLEAFLAGDAETFLSYMDDDIELDTAEHHPFLTQCRGRQQFLGVVGKIAAELDGFRFDIERVLGCGESSRLNHQVTPPGTGSFRLPGYVRLFSCMSASRSIARSVGSTERILRRMPSPRAIRPPPTEVTNRSENPNLIPLLLCGDCVETVWRLYSDGVG